MFVGNVNAAIRVLSDNESSGNHSLDTMINEQSVKEILLEKHPPAQPPYPSTPVTLHTPDFFHSVLFDSISPELIRSLTLKINGPSGPSGLATAAWKKLPHFSPLQLTYAMLCSRFIDKMNMYLLYRPSWSSPTPSQ